MNVPPLSAVSSTTSAVDTPVVDRATTDAARRAGRDFETVFVGRMLESMFAGIGTDGLFGGGRAESTWRGFMLDRYASAIAQGGTLGIGRQVEAEILRMSERTEGV